jgi:hypothetical protein
MASVWVRLRGSSLDPAQTALPLIGTGTQHTLGPIRISCHWPKDGKEKKGQFTLKERDSHTPKNTSKPKEKRSELLLLLLLLYTFLFQWLKASN